MTTWADFAKFEGYRISPIFDISVQGDNAEYSLTYQHQELPLSEVIVEVRMSFNDGMTWTDWYEISPDEFNNSITGRFIKGITDQKDFTRARLQYKVSIKATEAGCESSFDEFKFTIQPIIIFENSGDLSCKPEIWIYKVGDGDVSIINETNNGQEFKFTGLVDGETVYVDCENEYIETDLPLTYRYDNFNGNYLEFLRGKNRLRIIGNCHIQLRYQFTMLQG